MSDKLTEQAYLLQTCMQLALTDDLTGVYNRRALPGLLKSIYASLDGDDSVAIIFMDINDLRATNNVDGYIAGDSRIQLAAKTLQDNLRKTDCVIRLGGDEFLAILPGATKAEAEKVIGRLNTALPDELHLSAIVLTDMPTADDVLTIASQAFLKP